MPPLAFCREALTPALWAEITPLLTEHWREIATFHDIPLNPDVALYTASQEAGMLRVYTARVLGPDPLTNTLGGYAVFFVRPAPHYVGSLQAAQDILFILPQYRGAGWAFVHWCDTELREEGVQVVIQHVKLAHDFGHMLERQGYECVERIFVKRLDALVEDVPLVAFSDLMDELAEAFI